VALDVENVHAKCHITVVLQDKTWDLYRVESRDMLGGAFCCFVMKKRVALDVGNVHAKCHITVVLQDKTWDLNRVESRDIL